MSRSVRIAPVCRSTRLRTFTPVFSNSAAHPPAASHRPSGDSATRPSCRRSPRRSADGSSAPDARPAATRREPSCPPTPSPSAYMPRRRRRPDRRRMHPRFDPQHRPLVRARLHRRIERRAPRAVDRAVIAARVGQPLLQRPRLLAARPCFRCERCARRQQGPRPAKRRKPQRIPVSPLGRSGNLSALPAGDASGRPPSREEASLATNLSVIAQRSKLGACDEARGWFRLRLTRNKRLSF